MQVVPVNREALCFSWSLPGESDDGQKTESLEITYSTSRLFVPSLTNTTTVTNTTTFLCLPMPGHTQQPTNNNKNKNNNNNNNNKNDDDDDNNNNNNNMPSMHQQVVYVTVTPVLTDAKGKCFCFSIFPPLFLFSSFPLFLFSSFPLCCSLGQNVSL